MSNILSLLLEIDEDFELFESIGLIAVPIIIFVGFVAISIIGTILTRILTRRRKGNISKSVGSMINKTLDLANQKLDAKIEETKPTFCEYCGSLIPKDSNECTSCGAKKHNK